MFRYQNIRYGIETFLTSETKTEGALSQTLIRSYDAILRPAQVTITEGGRLSTSAATIMTMPAASQP